MINIYYVRGQTILFNFIHQESLGAIKLISKQYPDISYRSDNDGLYPITYCYAIKKIRFVLKLFYFKMLSYSTLILRKQLWYFEYFDVSSCQKIRLISFEVANWEGNWY